MVVISGVQIWPLSEGGSWTLELVGLHVLVRVQLKGWEPKERAPTAEGDAYRLSRQGAPAYCCQAQ